VVAQVIRMRGLLRQRGPIAGDLTGLLVLVIVLVEGGAGLRATLQPLPSAVRLP